MPLSPLSARRLRVSLFAMLAILLLAGCLVPADDGGDPRWNAETFFDGPAVTLAEATERGDLAGIRRLIRDDGLDPDTMFAVDGMPLLAWPIFTKRPESLRALLELGADPNARKNSDEDTALVLAAGLPDSTYLKILLEHDGDPDTRNSNNETLLLTAFLSGNQWQNIELLIAHGADINLPAGGVWDTVIGWYSARSGFDKVYWLLQKGADPTLRMRMREDPPDQGRMPIVEEIYWNPAHPEQVEWQRKCQHWLRDRGIERPEMPGGIRQLREAAGFPTEEKDIPLL